jgi:hypothetical protein
LRVELFMTLLAGFAGGLAGTLWGGFVTAPWLSGRTTSAAVAWRTESASRIVAGAAVYGLCGAAAGFLFWLGWGLVAVVATPWYQVGLLYGALLWAAATLPLLGVLALRGIERPGVVVALGLELLVAATAVGLFCAYVWHRSA